MREGWGLGRIEGNNKVLADIYAGVCCSLHLYELFSIAKTLGAKRVCKQAYDWISKHKIISRVISDSEAVSACIKFAGEHVPRVAVLVRYT